LKKIEQIIKRTAELFSIAASAAIVIAMVLVVINVILRAVFKSPILGTYEYTGFLAVLIISLGMAYVLLVNAHIAVDFIVEKFSIRARGYIDSITGFIVLVFSIVFTWNVFEYAIRAVENNQLSPTTQTPFYIFIFAMAVCFLLFCLVYVLKIRESLGKARLK